MPMGEFRRRVAIARAGVDEETAASEGWQTALSLSIRVSDDLQGVFLLLAKAALRNEECPSDQRIARAYGTHSARRARRLLGYFEEQGLVVVEDLGHVHVARDRATVYLDLSGEALHKRGYRQHTVEAPLTTVSLALDRPRPAAADPKSIRAPGSTGPRSFPGSPRPQPGCRPGR